MKISVFKKSDVKRIMRFTDGNLEVIDFKPAINGEIEFYEINGRILEEIYNEITSKSFDDISEMELAYRLIPHICDIEMDVTVEEFKEMIEDSSQQFIVFMESVFALIQDIFKSLSSITTMAEISTNIPEIGENKPTKEEMIEKLYDELSETTDKVERKRIVLEISKLQLETE